MKKNKKILLAIIIVLVLSIVSFFIFYKKDEYKLTRTEKKWIENNKNVMIDISVVGDIPNFSKDQNGLFLKFLNFFEKETNLETNRISYNYNSKAGLSKYSFKIIDEKDGLSRNDILFFEDRFVVLNIENEKIYDLSMLDNKKIGVFKNHLTSISQYISFNTKITYEVFTDEKDIFKELEDKKLDYIIVPKNQYLEQIIKKQLYVSYNLNSLYNKYVLTLKDKNKTLNSIITKKLNEFKDKEYNDLYKKNMNDIYFSYNAFTENELTEFKNKKYIYGYIENSPYDIFKESKLNGINFQFLNDFENFSNVHFTFKKYKNSKELIKDFNSNKIDVISNYYELPNIEAYNETIDVISSNYVILSNIKNDVYIDSFYSLKNEEIHTIKGTKLEAYFRKNSKATIKSYSDINKVLKSKDSLILVDINTYNLYKNTKLKNYYIVYESSLDFGYGFLVRTNEVNNMFFDFFQYYLINSENTVLKNKGINELLKFNFMKFLSTIVYILSFIFIALFSIIVLKKLKRKKILKQEKAQYIDTLTSLKNRNYLNDNMDDWDENKTYPKSIMIIDLNNIKDVNSDYGYEEGDKVIKGAANILIQTQLENSDIVRTDGNEFLIYLVGYKESEIVNYMRKLFRLMKELPYEYGAALGFSMINDDIKLVEDAINEAVLEMKKNKGLKGNDK